MLHCILIAISFLFVGCAANQQAGTDIRFYRPGSPESDLILRLRWQLASDPSFYTPRGPMTGILIVEGSSESSIPKAEISAIEDIWPDEIRMASPTKGDYEIFIPYGVGEGSLAIFRVASFRFYGRDPSPTHSNYFLRRKPDDAVEATSRRPEPDR